jgi:hypothetical protein
MAHQYKLSGTTVSDLSAFLHAANEFAGSVDALQSGLAGDIEDQRDHFGEKSESFIDSERGQQIEEWLSTLEEFLDTLNSLGEMIGDLDSTEVPVRPE